MRGLDPRICRSREMARTPSVEAAAACFARSLATALGAPLTGDPQLAQPTS